MRRVRALAEKGAASTRREARSQAITDKRRRRLLTTTGKRYEKVNIGGPIPKSAWPESHTGRRKLSSGRCWMYGQNRPQLINQKEQTRKHFSYNSDR